MHYLADVMNQYWKHKNYGMDSYHIDLLGIAVTIAVSAADLADKQKKGI